MSKVLPFGGDSPETGSPSSLDSPGRTDSGKVRPGKTLAHYRVERLLARGAMGEVYEAVDKRLGRTVALKLLSVDVSKGVEDGEQLPASRHSGTWACLEEARAAAVSHPAIPALFDVGEADGIHYLAFERVRGENLAERLRQGAVPLRQALKTAVQLGEALEAIHRSGWIHGDLKPANVMIGDSGQAKLLDFGLAFRHETGGVRPDGKFSGTPDFQPPEQMASQPVDHRSDLFQLGLLLYLAVTGRHPFLTADSPEPRPERLIIPPLQAGDGEIPLELEAIVRRCLKRDPEERYASAGELTAELRRLEARLHASAPPPAAAAELVVSPSPSVSAKANRTGWVEGLLHKSWKRSLPAALAAAALAGLATSALHYWLLGPGGGWVLSGLAVAALGLALGLRYRRSRPTPPVLDGSTAFRGLVPFLEADRERFFGRATDVEAIMPLLLDAEFRFGVLHGESGAGKTSLLRAGLMPRLRELGFLPLLTRSYRNPIRSILAQLSKIAGGAADQSAPAIEQMRRAARSLGTDLVVICDQFEEFFIHRSPEQGRPFLDLVGECYHCSDLPVRFLFSIRNDFLHRIASAFDGRIPEPLISSRRYHLRPFAVKEAAEVILASASPAGLGLSSDFCRRVAADLARHDQVMPSELQIVGTQLQSRRITTIQEYRRTGGKEPLLWSYLEEVIQACPDREAALQVLRSLISDDDTRRTITQSEIARRTRLAHPAVSEALRILTASRLVRELQDDQPWRYELMHEYLIARIHVLTGRTQDAVVRANRLFRQYLSNSAVDEKVRIPLSRLWFIRRYADLERGPRERALLAASLRAGLSKLALAGIFLALLSFATAAFLSMKEEWRSVPLSDGHRAAVRSAAFSPDGSRLVTVGEDGAAIVWDFARRARIAALRAHHGWIDALAFDPGGRWFATGGNGGRLIVWDAETLQEVKRLPGQGRPILAAAFSPDGRWLGVADTERTACWSVPSWEKHIEFHTTFTFGNLLFTSDSRHLLTSDGTAFDLATGRRPSGWPEVEAGGNWAALIPGRKDAVYASPLGWLAFHNLESGEVSILENAHQDHLRAVAVSRDGRLLASAAEDIGLWDAASRRLLARFEHTGVVWGLTFSPDGRYLVSTHGDGAVLLWDVVQRRRAGNLAGHAGAVQSVALSSRGGWLASGGEEGSVVVWDLPGKTKRAALSAHQSRVLAVAASPDGEVLASADWRGLINVWDVRQLAPLWNHQASLPVYALAVSPDSRLLAANVGLFDLREGRRLAELAGPSQEAGSAFYGLAFSPDGQRLAYTSIQGNLILFDIRKLEISEHFHLPGISLVSVDFSPDGKWLVTGEDEGAVRLWRSSPLSPAGELGRHGARVKSVLFSPDGSQAVSAGDDQLVLIWDLASRSLWRRIHAHNGPVLSVDLSADGQWMASGGQDRTVRLHHRTRTVWGYPLDAAKKENDP
ncbi:MAG TPA: protein kinase [Acidobacteriota bacterium]|nr:protein kinase [Acidobacteriota bacterium]